LAERYPTVKPGAVSYTNKETWLCGSGGVALSRIKAWLYRVEKALRDCLRQEDAEVPDQRIPPAHTWRRRRAVARASVSYRHDDGGLGRR
jgi:hypothetical protein